MNFYSSFIFNFIIYNDDILLENLNNILYNFYIILLYGGPYGIYKFFKINRYIIL